MSVEFSNIVYEVPNSRRGKSTARILHGISGGVNKGESLAILGPSGSGKTTLLDLLAGRSLYAASSGEILFNGRERSKRTKRTIGYVTQDDLFFSNLTVRQTLDFTADVRLSSNISKEEKQKRVDDVLTSLRLSRCAHTKIGDPMSFKGISGGERKRLNIANELMSDPAIILADECTSGLDSASARTVVELLKELSRRGKTVICTIHQPSSQIFKLFDKVLLLSSGHTAYFGTPAAASSYFTSIGYPFQTIECNPCDEMLELVIDDIPSAGNLELDVEAPLTQSQIAKRNILAAWMARGPRFYAGLDKNPDGIVSSNKITSEETTSGVLSAQNTTKDGIVRAISKRYWTLTEQIYKDPLPEKYPSSFWAQVRACGKRTILQKRGQLLEKPALLNLFAVTLMTIMFWFRMKRTEDTLDDRLGAFFFINVEWAFIAIFSALDTFPSERAVLNKDRASGSYRLSAYYLAKNIVEIPADLFYPLFFSVATYFIVNLSPSATAFLLHTFTLLSIVTASQSIGVLISALLTDIKEALVAAIVWVLFSMLLSGYYIDSDNIPVFLRWARHLSFIKFGYESMVRIEAMGPPFLCVDDGKSRTRYSLNGNVCPITEQVILEAVNLDDQLSIAANLACLIAWSTIVRTVGYFALKYLNKPQRSKKLKTIPTHN